MVLTGGEAQSPPLRPPPQPLFHHGAGPFSGGCPGSCGCSSLLHTNLWLAWAKLDSIPRPASLSLSFLLRSDLQFLSLQTSVPTQFLSLLAVSATCRDNVTEARLLPLCPSFWDFGCSCSGCLVALHLLVNASHCLAWLSGWLGHCIGTPPLCGSAMWLRPAVQWRSGQR